MSIFIQEFIFCCNNNNFIFVKFVSMTFLFACSIKVKSKGNILYDIVDLQVYMNNIRVISSKYSASGDCVN